MRQAAKLDAQKSRMFAPHLPWNTYKWQELGPTTMEYERDHETFYRQWNQKWFENFQFIFGNHNIKWSREHGFAVDADFLRRGSPFAQRAQTNISRTIAEALASFIYAQLPDWTVEMASQSRQRGKRFQKIVQSILDCYMERLNMDAEFYHMAMIYVIYGMVGCRIDWSLTSGGIIEVPRMRKIMAPVYRDWMAPNPYTGGLFQTPTQAMGSDGNPIFEERWEQVVDQMGRAIVDRMFSGDVRVWGLTPYEYARNIGSSGMHDARRVRQIRLMDYDEWLDEFGEKSEGATPAARNVKPIHADPYVYSFAVRHWMRMQYTTPPTLEHTFRRGHNAVKSQLFRHKVLVVESFDRPHPDKWRLGRHSVITNGECTHIKTPSYHTNKRDGWHPFAEALWMSVPPSTISSGPMNDVIAKNRELNQKDSLIATAARRNMGSMLLIQSGMGLDPQDISGEPGQAHEVNNVAGARFLHDEIPIPPAVPNLRTMDKEDVYEVSGAQDALRGDRSKGASSGYAYRQLQEREERRLMPSRRNFERMGSTIGEKIFSCLQANVKSLDKEVMGFLMRSGAGQVSEQEVITLLTNPVDYGVDVKIKESSMAFRSLASKKAEMMELANGPAGIRLQDAKVLDQFLEYFDAEVLRDSSGAHRDRAERENDAFMDLLHLGPNSEGLSYPVVSFADDDLIHMQEHDQWEIENMEELRKNEMLYMQFLLHRETHRIQHMEKMAQQPPGASLMTPAMMQYAQQVPPPGAGQIYMQNQQIQAQQAQTGQAPPPGQNPQAPRQPKPEPGSGGPGQTDPGAPSQNTAPGGQQGGGPYA